MKPNTNQVFSEEDLKKCPFHKNKMPLESPFKEKITMNSETDLSARKSTNEDAEPKTCPYNFQKAEAPKMSPKASVHDSDSESEEEQLGGGCPVMSVKGNKVNPGLFIPEPSFQKPYVSPFQSFLSPSIFQINKSKLQNMKLWNKFPMFLKHTLFYFGENFDKYRNLEIGYKFFVIDELREKGNACFTKGKYTKALSYYEKGASLLKWLESTPDEFISKMREYPKISELAAQMSGDPSECTLRDAEILRKRLAEATKEREESNSKKQSQEDHFHDLILTNFNDNNVRVCTGPELKDVTEQEMYNNMLFGCYSNIAMCYLKMQHFKEAKLTINEIESFAPQTSLLLFRKAQVLIADCSSNVSDLEEALNSIKLGMELKRNEKLFEHNENFLRMFNLQNHATIFHEMGTFIEQRIAQKSEKIKDAVNKVLKRAKQFHENELDIIKRGLVPQEGHEHTLLLGCNDLNFEKKLLKKIKDKYKQAITFFAGCEDNKDKQQVEIGQQALSQIYELEDNFYTLWNLDFENGSLLVKTIIDEANTYYQ